MRDKGRMNDSLNGSHSSMGFGGMGVKHRVGVPDVKEGLVG